MSEKWGQNADHGNSFRKNTSRQKDIKILTKDSKQRKVLRLSEIGGGLLISVFCDWLTSGEEVKYCYKNNDCRLLRPGLGPRPQAMRNGIDIPHNSESCTSKEHYTRFPILNQDAAGLLAVFAVIEISGSVMGLSEIRYTAFIILGSRCLGWAHSRPPWQTLLRITICR